MGPSKIKDTIDPTLTFIAACRSAVCGACSIKVNGQAMLGCESKIDDITERFGSDTIEIAPIGNFDVIRDLAVDWEAKVNRLKTVAPWIFMKPEFNRDMGSRQTPEDFKNLLLTQNVSFAVAVLLNVTNCLQIVKTSWIHMFIQKQIVLFKIPVMLHQWLT